MGTDLLIVDDDPALRGMLSYSLEGNDFNVSEAGSRQEALKKLQEFTPSVVVLDMGMPPHEHTPDEGVAVLEWLANNQPNIKTIVLTGQNAESVSYLALKHGAFDFLEKPISQESLLLAVRRAFLFFEQAQRLKEQEGVQRVEIDAMMGEGVKSIRNQAEEKLLKQVLADTEFNVHETARRLGIKRENVYYLIKKYGLQRDQ
ncbi:response regulator [Thiomicrorhabdus sp. ZW0627]|uniref:response regulator n=1 Tax=Thiomicrorhabdus sp. ZW0627 TaxID=3039774 RepID=UPI002436A299|nr:response regulator [Thiomicrorhabdus sp. ZW0627]MDG6774774.1 response regulator [Thiomicrorhabdus sp. ZW0627]